MLHSGFLSLVKITLPYPVTWCFSPTKNKCNMEPPSETTYSNSSQITGALETKSIMALVRGVFSAFYI